MTITKYILQLVVMIILTGCATMAINYMPPNLPTNSLETIANDIAPVIAEHNPAKSTRFILHQDDFGRNLANALGKLGYEVAFLKQTDQQPENAEEIRYTIDWISPTSLYIALTIDNRQRLTRTYTIVRDKVVPDKTKIIGVKDE